MRLFRTFKTRGLLIAVLCLSCLWLALFSLRAGDVLQRGDMLAICGDSITEQKLYSLYIEEYLLMCQPQAGLQTVQYGWSGERAVNFLSRQKKDCFTYNPTVATVCYGMNDAGYRATDPETLNLYKSSTATIVRNFKEGGVRLVVLGGPGVVDSDTYKRCDASVYNKTLGDFSEAAKQVANEEGVLYANIHNIMIEVMTKAKAKYGSGYYVAGADGVHPGPNGHLVMAYAFLKALGCQGDIGTITVDLKGVSAVATEGHKICSVTSDSVEVESSRYPFCFYGNKSEPTTSSIIDFFPFNEELNRYRLIVKNASSPKIKITWGKESRVYAASDLEKGVNLAADFINNPFSEPFAKVELVMREQQNLEASARTLSLVDWRRLFPEKSAALDQLDQSIVEKDRALRKASSAAISPVRHIIKIEPSI